MELIDCTLVRRAIAAAVQTQEPPSDAVLAHIAGCASCQGALLLLRAEASGSQADVPAASHAMVAEQLPAYIDCQRAEGTLAALRAYPQVAWHLWICPECAEEYRLITALLDAEQSGALPALPVASVVARPRPLAQLTLSRAFLAQALPLPSPQLGALRGTAERLTVIYEAEEAGQLVSLAVAPQGDAGWSLIVTVEPPIAGRLTLTLDEQVYQAALHNGVATIPAIPTAALAAPTGPDLVGRIDGDSLVE